MKLPWSNLVQYGLGMAVIIMMVICGIVLLAVVGVAVAFTKISFLIK